MFENVIFSDTLHMILFISGQEMRELIDQIINKKIVIGNPIFNPFVSNPYQKREIIQRRNPTAVSIDKRGSRNCTIRLYT